MSPMYSETQKALHPAIRFPERYPKRYDTGLNPWGPEHIKSVTDYWPWFATIWAHNPTTLSYLYEIENNNPHRCGK